MNISTVLLAGGASRRMGQDKATVLFRGKPLWQIQVELLRILHPAEIFVSARTNPAWRPTDVRYVADLAPARGPLSGIAASLATMRSPHLLSLAIDMPFMTEEFLRRLSQQIEAGVGIVPKIENRFEPLAAIYPREAEIEVRDALAGKDFSLQTFVRRLIAAGKLREVFVTQGESNLFRNLNQPSDLTT